MDKQKQIEEMECTLYDYCLHYDDCIEGSERNLAKFLINAGYRKIPENAVVLTKKKDIQQYEWSKLVDKMGVIEFGEKLRKQTAEKFAEKIHNLFNRDIKDSVVYTQEEKDILKDFVESIYEICKEITGG